MKLVIIDKTNEKRRISKLLDWLIHMIAYALILITVSVIFKKTIYIDNSLFGLWGLLAAIIIYIINKTVKPLVVWLTLPLTAITLGLFYPVINVLILYIVDFILGSHFIIHGFFMSFFVAILISIMNAVMDECIIDPILKRGR